VVQVLRDCTSNSQDSIVWDEQIKLYRMKAEVILQAASSSAGSTALFQAESACLSGDFHPSQDSTLEHVLARLRPAETSLPPSTSRKRKTIHSQLMDQSRVSGRWMDFDRPVTCKASDNRCGSYDPELYQPRAYSMSSSDPQCFEVTRPPLQKVASSAWDPQLSISGENIRETVAVSVFMFC
jgi:hypothetical protein